MNEIEKKEKTPFRIRARNDYADEIFCKEYIKGYDFDVAFNAAYPQFRITPRSKKRFLNRPYIVRRLPILAQKAIVNTDLCPNEIILRLRNKAKANIGDVLDWSGDVVTIKDKEDLSLEALQAIKRIKVTRTPFKVDKDTIDYKTVFDVEMYDSVRADELLGRYLKMWDSGNDETNSQQMLVELLREMQNRYAYPDDQRLEQNNAIDATFTENIENPENNMP